MNIPSINLIRDRIPTPGLRRRMYAGFMIYLAVGGALMCVAAWHFSNYLARADQHLRHARLLTESFAREHPGEHDPAAYVDGLGNRLRSEAVRLHAIQDFIEARRAPAHLLYGLASGMGSNMALVSLHIDAQGQMAWSVQAEGEVTDPGAPERLAAAWGGDRWVRPCVCGIQPLTAERSFLNRRPVVVYRFASQYKGKAEGHGSGTVQP